MEPVAVTDSVKAKQGCCPRLTRWFQDTCYQIFARTVWDQIISGFRPGRVRAMELLDLRKNDSLLLVGEGTGADLECLPDGVDKTALRAFDFSPEMVRQCKLKAIQLGIPEKNCFVGDAQKLPYTEEKFHKIYFPLSIGSIPDPTLALQEAERVLAPSGKVVIFEKLVDDEAEVSTVRYVVNTVTVFVFADINRNLSDVLKRVPALKLVHYESLAGKLDGRFARFVGQFYRLAVVVRAADYPDKPAIQAKLKAE